MTTTSTSLSHVELGHINEVITSLTQVKTVKEQNKLRSVILSFLNNYLSVRKQPKASFITNISTHINMEYPSDVFVTFYYEVK